MKKQKPKQDKPVEYFTDDMHKDIFPFPEAVPKNLGRNTKGGLPIVRITKAGQPGRKTRVR